MPPRLHLLRSSRPKISALQLSRNTQPPLCIRIAPRRNITADERPLPEADETAREPNQEQLPHVSEEAATMGKITGEGGPDIEQGTPVQEVRWSFESSKGCPGLTLVDRS